ncbi:GNAT family N-acetyltransferase [Luedemannella flava]|uniref:GNAT family N-acetyltransferase n=1 Tax=Luedemannella flava TaxID=349316 RepID=A0ABP4XUA4_9ACTN
MSSLVIRAAGPDDGPAIAAVQRAAWQATYGAWIPEVVAGLDPVRTADNWARASRRPDQRVAVAVGDGRVVGYAWSGPPDGSGDADSGELLALYVHPAAQRRGAGRLLVADALAWLASTGRERCLVWAVERFEPARRFYEREGFTSDPGLTRPWRGLAEIRYSRPL